MDQLSEAIAILQKARDALAARLTERIVDSQLEIVEDAEGGSYLSEIEAIYEQLGGRLAHVNAMLSNLPPAPPVGAQAGETVSSETAASEMVYADMATGPGAALDVEVPGTLMLALPAPPPAEEARVEPMVEIFASIVMFVKRGELSAGARILGELFDIRPSLARRGVQAFEQNLRHFPELARRFEQFGASIDAMNEYAAATLLGECFGFQPIDALLLVRSIKRPITPRLDCDK